MNYSINEILKLGYSLLNKEISINGWVKTKRKFKNNIIFIDINDGSCIDCVQIIVKDELYYNNEILNIISGYSLNVIGNVIKSIGNKQLIEIVAKKIKIFGKIKNQKKYPLSPKNHSFEYLREISHLRPRTYFFGSVSRIRNSLFYEIHTFMNKNKFIWIPAPIITSEDTEGSSRLFSIYSKDDENFFKKDVFLTVSGQLHAEAYACSMSKVYSFGPVFRAEDSNTRKHLAEFWMLEPEMSFFYLQDIIKFSEIFIKNIFEFIITNNKKDIEYINSKTKNNTIKILENWISKNFLILEYSEAVKILNKYDNTNINWGESLNSNNENFLLKYFDIPIFITKYPKDIKSFYMKTSDDEKTVLSMDLIFPGVGEIIGGSERENRLEILKKTMNYYKIKNDWYLDLRKYGTVPHSGFGMGFERLILLITGIYNIRDVSAFPRFPNSV